MAEVTLNTQLSGSEVVEAVLDKVRLLLQRDCNLNRNSAYDFFRGTITLDLHIHDTGVDVPIKGTAALSHGEEDAERENVDHVQASLEMTPQTPNDVRIDSGQEVPVLTKGEHGESVVKGVRYGRGAATGRTR